MRYIFPIRAFLADKSDSEELYGQQEEADGSEESEFLPYGAGDEVKEENIVCSAIVSALICANLLAIGPRG